jgi:hypothetical protein
LSLARSAFFCPRTRSTVSFSRLHSFLLRKKTADLRVGIT